MPHGQVQTTARSGDAGQDSASFNYNRHAGWIHGSCLAIKNPDLNPGALVQVVTLGSPQRTFKTSIAGTATSDTKCLALLPDRITVNQRKGRSFYVLDYEEGADFMAIGLVEYKRELLPVTDIVRMDIDHDGKQEMAGFCQTSEGVKFFLLPVDQSDGTPIWSDYYYLGYDTKPTCKD